MSRGGAPLSLHTIFETIPLNYQKNLATSRKRLSLFWQKGAS